MKPGIYYDLPNDVYHAAPGLNASKLKTMAKCPGLIQWAKDCPEDEEKKGVFSIGNALHCLVLEPEKFNGLYVVEPVINRRTSAGKQQAIDFASEHSCKTILTDKEFKMLHLMHGSVMAHPDARRLLANKTGTEVSVFAEEGGQLMKIRIDLESEIGGKTFLVDLKTVDKIENISKAINERGYDLQYAHYMATYDAHHGKSPDYFIFIFVAKSVEIGQYPTYVGELSEEDKISGHEKRENLVQEYKSCKSRNSWPGIMTFSRYKWAK